MNRFIEYMNRKKESMSERDLGVATHNAMFRTYYEVMAHEVGDDSGRYHNVANNGAHRRDPLFLRLERAAQDASLAAEKSGVVAGIRSLQEKLRQRGMGDPRTCPPALSVRGLLSAPTPLPVAVSPSHRCSLAHDGAFHPRRGTR